METQVKGARAKQKNYAKGQRKASERDERRLSSGPTSELEYTKRILTTNKRAIARFAKGPLDTGGFTYPRRHVAATVSAEALPFSLFENECIPAATPGSVTMSEITTETPCSPISSSPALSWMEPTLESSEIDAETLAHESAEAVLMEAPLELSSSEPVLDINHVSDEDSVIANKQADVELSAPKQVDVELVEQPKQLDSEETADDTIGPDDSRSSESDSEEESDVEPATPTVATVVPLKIVTANEVKPTPKPTPAVSLRKVTPAAPTYRKVLPQPPVPVSRSSWSKFLPLVIEIKATIPYPMHLLGVTLLLVTGFLLRLLYQFGADLGGEMELQGQLMRLVKLAFLFFVVAICVNFVEDNKELPHKDPPTQPQPKLRPSKMSKNKKKMMLKV